MFLSVCVEQFVPCTARRAFNELVRDQTVLFRALGSTYNINVNKGRSKTRLHGKYWQQFITKNNLGAGDMLVFTMTPHPRISVATGKRGNNKDETDEIYVDSDSSEDRIDDDDRIIVAQRVCLNNHEKNRLVKLLPVGAYVGVLFVTRLTSTNLNRHEMVCTHKIASFMHL